MKVAIDDDTRGRRPSWPTVQPIPDAPPLVRGVEEAGALLVGWGLESVRGIGGQTRDSGSENLDE